MEQEIYNERYARYYEMFGAGKDYKQESDFLQACFAAHSHIPVKAVLDVGCGTGLHAQALTQKGFSLTGIDLSEHMVALARSKHIPNAQFFSGNMIDFNLNRQFDGVICMFSVLGYLTSNEEIKPALSCMRNHLKKGGLLVLDCWNGLGVMRELPSSRTKDFESQGHRIVRTSYPRLDSVNHVNEVTFKVSISKDGKDVDSFDEFHRVRFFFPQELKKYLEDEGFEVLEFCKTYELGVQADESDWNMAVVARLKN